MPSEQGTNGPSIFHRYQACQPGELPGPTEGGDTLFPLELRSEKCTQRAEASLLQTIIGGHFYSQFVHSARGGLAYLRVLASSGPRKSSTVTPAISSGSGLGGADSGGLTA